MGILMLVSVSPACVFLLLPLSFCFELLPLLLTLLVAPVIEMEGTKTMIKCCLLGLFFVFQPLGYVIPLSPPFLPSFSSSFSPACFLGFSLSTGTKAMIKAILLSVQSLFGSCSLLGFCSVCCFFSVFLGFLFFCSLGFFPFSPSLSPGFFRPFFFVVPLFYRVRSVVTDGMQRDDNIKMPITEVSG